MNRGDSGERRLDLEIKRERSEYQLERDRREDKDMRIMRWILLMMALGVFLYAFLGVTVFAWRHAGEVLAILVSGVLGSALRDPLVAFWQKASPFPKRELPPT